MLAGTSDARSLPSHANDNAITLPCALSSTFEVNLFAW